VSFVVVIVSTAAARFFKGAFVGTGEKNHNVVLILLKWKLMNVYFITHGHNTFSHKNNAVKLTILELRFGKLSFNVTGHVSDYKILRNNSIILFHNNPSTQN
jgi:hypothetical protein